MTEVAAEISANLLFKPSSFSTVMGYVAAILIIWLLSLWKENRFRAMQLQHSSQRIEKWQLHLRYRTCGFTPTGVDGGGVVEKVVVSAGQIHFYACLFALRSH